MLRITHLELRVLAAVQQRSQARAVVAGARGLSFVGEHAWGWLALAGVGAATSPRRRSDFVAAGVAVVAAHAGAVVLKRVVRRTRPLGGGVEARVGTPSRLSFPSAHAASTTAAAVSLAPVLGALVTAPVAATMAASRLVLGVHYPSDVLAGAALGGGTAALVRRSRSRGRVDA